MADKRLSGRERRHLRLRKKIRGRKDRPRLVVFRSNRHMYAQAVDDVEGRTIAGVSGSSKTVAEKVKEIKERFAESRVVGEQIARRLVEQGITKAVFDRAGYRYHGRVKALAEAARKAGLEF
jgi:large subunit ribosomal protein L18